ncbi:alpha/beta hydrolase family esterase [Undibacterium sp. Di27W]|uniref:alpha/beta hydrolase family esterase n=1 Tax=Undibacterium sp. Di27W TaxID=3413036 RepID=UPI003BF1FE9A
MPFTKVKFALRQIFLGHDHKAGKVASIESAQLSCPEGLRPYLIARPSQASASKRPLIIILHGSGASAAQVLGLAFPPSPLSAWLEIAEREQLLVIAPDGCKRFSERSWNDGFAEIKSNPKTDDCAFISALIDKAVEQDHADPARVYVIGVSKGGMMAFRLATEIAPRLAAFATVLASMPVKSNCGLPQTPLSALVIASTADPLIPYVGGKFFYTPSFAPPMLSMETSVDIWRELAGLAGQPVTTEFLHTDKNDPTLSTMYMWGSDPAKLQVGLLTIAGGGHSEPSPSKRYPRLITSLVGAQSGDFETAEVAWQFFKDKRSGLSP